MLTATLKGCKFLITLEISSSNIDKGESISAGYEALGISVGLASDMGGNNWDVRASAFSEGVIAMPDGVTRLSIVGRVRGRWLFSFAHCASGQIPLLPLTVSATACLKCAALAF